jgi:hypothetical protein
MLIRLQSADITPTFLSFLYSRDAKELVKLLAAGLQLDDRSSTVRGCSMHAQSISFERNDTRNLISSYVSACDRHSQFVSLHL